MRLYDYVEGLRMLTLVFADASVGALYLWSADSIRKGTANGLEAALGEYFYSPGLLCTSSNPIVCL